MSTSEQTTLIFRQALETFVSKVERDEQVIAVILLGSLSYDQVWEKSDIDLKLIVHDQKLSVRYTCFVEDEVPINASIQTRDEFKRGLERSLQGSFHHSMLVRSKLLFTRDESIAAYFEQIRYVGERDRQLQLLRIGSHTLSLLAKAEKWLYVKKDFVYSGMWIIKMVDLLAQIEVILQEDVPMRECIQQAIDYRPEFFHAIYTELIQGKLDEHKVASALALINHYLKERAEHLFHSVLAYLKEEADLRTVTSIVEKFAPVLQMDTGSITTVCDWLAELGLLAKMESETKATPKSRIPLTEPAYMFEQDEWEMITGS